MSSEANNCSEAEIELKPTLIPATGSMSSLEHLISEARLLGNRLRENDVFADTLISQASNIQDRLNAMKQYEEDLNKLNDIPKRKPRHKLIMEIAQESKQIRDLKTENLELKACLDEHQTALEIIMNKYREQMRQFMMTKSLENNIVKVMEANNYTESAMREKICEMVSVMRKAATVDDENAEQESEKLTQLITENRGLKEMLRIHQTLGVSLQEDSEVESITQTSEVAAAHSTLGDQLSDMSESVTPTPEQMTATDQESKQ